MQAVVAIEPFATAREEVPHFGRVMVPGIGWLISDKTYQKSLDEAGLIANYNPDEADAVKAIRGQPPRCSSCTGRTIGSCRTSRASDCTRPPGPQRAGSVPYLGHVALWVDPGGHVAQRARDWFDRWIGNGRGDGSARQ